MDISNPIETVPPIEPGLKLPTILGTGALFKFSEGGGDVKKVFQFFASEAGKSPGDGAPLLDLAMLHLIKREKEEAYRVQSEALDRQLHYRVVGSQGKEKATRRRILALMAPGDFMNNAQLEFILDGSDIGLDVLYVVPGKPLPSALPEHDVVFCAVNESDENLPVLTRIEHLFPRWPRPALNAPGRIKHLSRDGIAALFAGSKTICAPSVRRVARADLQAIASSAIDVRDTLPGTTFPVVVRPVGSHAGKNFEKIDSPELLDQYLAGQSNGEDDFYLAPFADYRGADGVFRKYRVTLIDRKPYLCHMASSDQWKIHYVNVGMAEDAAKRADEARAMATFEEDFAVRHAAAFAELGERIGLDYFGIDCAEMPDGRLLLFEAETAMVIHNLDSPALYPYKQPQMAKVFAAFYDMIDRASARRANG